MAAGDPDSQSYQLVSNLTESETLLIALRDVESISRVATEAINDSADIVAPLGDRTLVMMYGKSTARV